MIDFNLMMNNDTSATFHQWRTAYLQFKLKV